jgi:hypothetical protein
MPGFGFGNSRSFRRGGGVDPISADLAFYYKLNGNAYRSYGTNNGGPVNVSYVAGLNGQCASFDGTGYISVDDSDDFNVGAGDFTWGIWVNLSTIGVDHFAFGKSDWLGGNTSFLIRIFTDNTIRAYIENTVGGGITLQSTTTVSANNWYLVIVKKSGTNYSLEINNSEEDTDSLGGSVRDSGYKCSIGAFGEYRAAMFNGKVDSVFGWKRVLTIDECDLLWNGGDGWAFNSPAPVAKTNPLQFLPLDFNGLGYSTFQDHNKKILKTDYGLFAAYNKTANGTYTSQTWNLVRSTDDGLSWSIIHTDSCYYGPPCMDVDSGGNIYLINDDTSTSSELLIFSAPLFGAPSSHAITSVVAGKHSMILDEANDRIYYFKANRYMNILNMSGTELSVVEVLQDGVNGYCQYPFFTKDDSGSVYFAWVTDKVGGPILYRNIMYITTRDNGVTWEQPDGTTLTLPVTADEAGLGTRISLDADVLVNKFLSGFNFANDKLHAVYWLDSSPNKQRHVRINPLTGIVESTTDQIFGVNGSINSFDGQIVKSETDGTSGSPQPIYFISSIFANKKMAYSVSTDNGATWAAYGENDDPVLNRVYSVNSISKVQDGKIYGTFTLVPSWATTYYEQYSGFVYLFQLSI